MLPLAVVTLLIVVAAGFAGTAWRVVTRAQRAEGDTAARHRFLAAFDARGAGPARVPSELLVQTYELVGARAATALGGGLRPTSRLHADLGLTRADVEDVALLVAAHCEAQLPHARDLDALVRQAGTVEEFVRFLAPFVEARPAAQAA